MQKLRHILSKKQHASFFIAFISLGILLGVLSVQVFDSQIFRSVAWLVALIIITILVFWKRLTWMLTLAIFAGFVIGINRSLPSYIALKQYEGYLGKEVIVTGKVTEDVELGKKNDYQIKFSQIKINGKKVAGTIWASTYEKNNIKRSYVVTLRGKMQKSFGSFYGSIFRTHILKVIDNKNDQARNIRDSVSKNIRTYISEPEASLGIGYLVGQRSALPIQFEQSLRIVGLTHIVVASGYNLTLLVRFARRIFAPISKYQAAVASGLMIVGFVLVTGFSPSMTRAAIVASLSLAAWYYGRNIHPLVLLPFSAAITVILNPSYLWGDLGWYLSFAAFAGVMILAPLLQNFFFGSKKPGSVRQILGETVSAQIVTIPIIAYSFGTISLFALPANLLVLPFVPFAMALVALAGVIAFLMPSLAHIASLPAQFLLSYMVGIVNWIASLQNASIAVSFGIAALIASYFILILFALFLQKVTKHNFRQDNIVD